ncbi:uncharacterized protein LOC129742851 [Uranotaenia lowii]|uniref:uncharacterized protein LOC129742851 n=1 Tax=Uranotaenia lowii TaxID=190385 RepID=UPI0024784F85|nr:uncharacterized protein LOC129742851 [Uranotaenia lowii]
MATDRATEFASIILKDLQLPEKALKVFGSQFCVERIVEVSRDEISSLFAESSPDEENKLLWNVEEIFRRIAEWRQKQGYDLLSFATVDVESLSPKIQRPIVQPDDKAQEQKTFKNQRQESLSYEKAPTSDEQEVVSKPSCFEKDSGKISTHRALPLTPEVLLRLLRETEGGLNIIKRSACGLLSAESRKELLGIIVDYHLKLGIRTDESVLQDYTAAILAALPFEKAIEKQYFIPRGGRKKNPGGQLYNLISNTRQKRAKRARIEDIHQQSFANVVIDISDDEVDKIVEDALIWLKQYSKPWTTTLDKWKQSFPKRKPQLLKSTNFLDVIRTFRHYSDEYGHQLVDIDFRLLSIGNPYGFQKWDDLILYQL